MQSIGSFSYGLEISPNGRYLYNTISGESGPRVITQYDLNAGGTAAINNSAVNLTPASPDGLRYGQLQLGPDGKIYHTIFNWNNIGGGGYCRIATVASPNTGGTGANYTESPYIWPASATGVGSSMGLTSFHKGFLSGKAAITSSLNNLDAICLGDAVPLVATSTGTITSYSWNIDQNLNATIDYTTGPAISHTYSATGTYTIELVVTDNCGYTYTSQQQAVVLPKITNAGTVTCPNTGTVTSPNGAYTYVWYSDAGGTKPIATGTNVTLPISGSGTVYVRAESSASSSTTSGSLLTSSNSINGNVGGNTITVNFTVTNAITLNSFKWYPQQTWGGAGTDTRNATVSIVDQATGTTTYWTNTRSITFGNTPAQITESPAVVLPAGTYTIKWTSTAAVLSSWGTPMTPTSDANVSITGTANYLAAFNYTVTNYTITTLDCSQMSAAINYNCPLPVSWLNFEAVHVNGGNQLTWATSLEINTSHFEIERSFDGQHFDYVGQVSARGNSKLVVNYSYLDETEASGVVYYRLKQVDIDGKYDYSRIVVVNSNSASVHSLLPNPGDGVVYLIGGNFEEQLMVNVLDVQGRIVKANIDAHTGSSLDLVGLPKGVYLVQVISPGAVQTLRYVLQ